MTEAVDSHLSRRRESKRRNVSYRLDIWPLNTEADYQRMAKVMDKLMLLDDPTPSQAARREIMLTLMEDYENKHHRIDTSDITPHEILKSMLDERGLTASDLGRILGNRSLGAPILSGKRELSKGQIRKLADHFGVSPALFF